VINQKSYYVTHDRHLLFCCIQLIFRNNSEGFMEKKYDRIFPDFLAYIHKRPLHSCSAKTRHEKRGKYDDNYDDSGVSITTMTLAITRGRACTAVLINIYYFNDAYIVVRFRARFLVYVPTQWYSPRRHPPLPRGGSHVRNIRTGKR